jgi:folate-binding Fe-S cluster repair protein YgfZ
VLLPEIPVADLVSYAKGCYVGQEVVIRIRDRGHVNRHLRGLLVEGAGVPPTGAAVYAAETIGRDERGLRTGLVDRSPSLSGGNGEPDTALARSISAYRPP